MNYYIYQIINLMPQLIAVQIVVWLYGSDRALIFAKAFYIVSMLSLLIDWGASSIGSRHLNGSINSSEKHRYINIYEKLRFGIFIGIVFIYGVLVYLNYINKSFELGLGVFFGLCAAVIFPNWLNLARKIDSEFLIKILIYRLSGLAFLLIGKIIDDNSSVMVIYYYGVLAVGAIFFRVEHGFLISNKSSWRGKDIVEVFKNGAIFTTGTSISYLISGAGSVLILNKFQENGFVDFALAERYLAIGRSILGLIFQRNYLRIGGNKENLIDSKVIARYIIFLAAFYMAIFFYGYIIQEKKFIAYFTILFVGFSLSGFSHIWITQNLLGKERYLEWLLVLIAAIFIYISAVSLLFKFKIADGSCVASIATMSAEISIFAIGFLMRKRK